MSHLVTISTQVRDPEAVKAACKRIGIAPPVYGTYTMYDRAKPTGWAVNLPDWNYPVVCDTTTGTVHYDNFRGNWGEQSHLDRFMQAYAAEKAKIEAKKKGYRCTEATQPDGSIRLTLHAGS